MYKYFSSIIAALLLCLTVPAMSQAYEVNSDEEFEGLYDPFDEPDDPMTQVEPPDLDLENPFYKPGFHAALGLGYQFVPCDSVSSGYHYFEASAQGGFISIDLGYHWKYFAISGNISPRAAWLTKDAMIRGRHFQYAALNDGDWDGYFLSLGVKAEFFVPLRDIMFMTFGFGLDFPIGLAPCKREHVEYQFRVGIDIGIYWKLTNELAFGLDVAVRGRLRNDSPWNTDFVMHESKRTAYLEPMLRLVYHP
ncbi:MAG: hypothetical protein IJU23_08230 [Proteobacteria bacterium]|nr:hypothetical protein [Pseudomonadota bacterium]